MMRITGWGDIFRIKFLVLEDLISIIILIIKLIVNLIYVIFSALVRDCVRDYRKVIGA